RLVDLDGELDLREYCYLRILAKNLDLEATFLQRANKGRLKRTEAGRAARTLLRIVADHGVEGDSAMRDEAYAAGMAALGQATGKRDAMLAGRAVVAELDRSLVLLQHLKSADRHRLVEALAAVVLSNANVSVMEIELLRAICAALDCPLPPLTTAQTPPPAIPTKIGPRHQSS
ncbi:MAG TPA: hypothetical protein VF389_08360, partial [Woeseiaceae bacterium]